MSESSVLCFDEFKSFYGEFYKVSENLTLNENSVPENLRPIIHYAEFWGITDDWKRQDVATAAEEAVVSNLKSVIEEYDEDLDRWLAGPEASAPKPSQAYLAFSAMRMAADFM